MLQSSYVYVCGPAQSVGRLYYYPCTETLPENAIAMAETQSGIFEFTFAIGEQVNDDAFNFAFYLDKDLTDMFSGKTTAEHSIAYDGTLGSSYFAVGKGYLGHADGHFYKRQANRHLPKGSCWTAVIDIRGGLKAAPVYIKEYTGPTGIVELKGNGNLKNDKEHGGNLYDLCGRNVATSPTLSASVPRKGIYIWDGKKILVR